MRHGRRQLCFPEVMRAHGLEPVSYATFISPISDHPVASIVWLMIFGVADSACGISVTAVLKCSLVTCSLAGLRVAEPFHQNVFRRILQAA